MSTRAEFSAATQRLLAERAGYQCSVLLCGKLTIGPGQAAGSVIRKGMAAHIYAAAEGGPRGTGGLSVEERRSPSNGIWCCYDCGKKIDSDGGSSYAATQLQAWKRLHEARKGAEINGVPFDRFGIVESVTANSAPALSGSRFQLGMRNIITGRNGVGKSVLLRLIASVADPSHIAKLSQTSDVDIAVRWFDPYDHEVVTTGRAGDVRQVLDGQRVPYVARPFKTILLKEPSHRALDLVSLAQHIDLSLTAMKAVVELLPEHSYAVREVEFHGHSLQLGIETDGRLRRVAESRLSGYEVCMVWAEIAAIHASHHAKAEPTFILLDEFLDHFHLSGQVKVLERLQAVAGEAQMAVVTHSSMLVADVSDTWSVLELEPSGHRHGPNSPIDLEIEASPRRPHVAPGSGHDT